ncbi:solute carrier family 22 member 4-like [Arctopsyche grandis]|uniref:solute carrier family 22 member 4-like n=1 Tax=Arctopsyche grandis TaxID=121162 RepID=UPI00406D7A6D
MGRESRVVSIDVDTIIAELGHGKFHAISFFFIAVAIFFNSITGASFIFTARDTKYRCYVPECDTSNRTVEYEPQWLANWVPYNEGTPAKCERNVALNLNATYNCSEPSYNVVEKCDEWVYGEGESIVREFGIPCQEWKRALVGTINSIGQFICLSFSGFISDTIGRRSVMVYATVLSGVIGVAQSYANDYWTFLFFEFLVTAVGSGAYSASFILGIEITIPEKRVLGSTIMNVVCGIATISLGVAAWLVPNWRYLLRFIYFPSVIMILSFWLIPESVRWLFVKGRKSEASRIIQKAAKMNGVSLSEKVSKYLEHISAEEGDYGGAENKKSSKKLPLRAVFKSRILILRLIVCAFCWMTNAFVYYGLSLNAVSIMGSKNNPYLNFILVSVVELPAQAVVVLMLDTVGRRICLCSSLIGSALSCFAFILIPSEQQGIGLVAYLLGKLFITVSFNVIYIYTTELFPTSLRHSIMSCCSMLGRIGSMLAPQTPLLEIYFSALPMILFGSTAIISGLSILTFPETLHIKLPDSIEEAENVAKSDRKRYSTNIIDDRCSNTESHISRL